MLKKELKLTQLQEEVLIGHLLGDGCLYPSGYSDIARLKVEQSLKQREFVEWLFEVFGDLVRTPLKEKHYIVSTIKGTFPKNSIYFNTLSFKSLYNFYILFYRARKKIIPKNINQLLTPRSFTVWFMGDGSIKSKECNGRILNTHGFTEPEVLKMCRILNERFNLITSIRKQKDGWQIYISAKSARVLFNLVSPHILPYFRYKLPKISLEVNRLPKA